MQKALNVLDDQFVQVGVCVLAAHAQQLAHCKLRFLLHLENVNVLKHAIRDLPGDRQMIVTLGRRPNYNLAVWLGSQIFFGLQAIERLEIRMLDDTLGPSRCLILFSQLLFISGFQDIVPSITTEVDRSLVGNTQRIFPHGKFRHKVFVVDIQDLGLGRLSRAQHFFDGRSVADLVTLDSALDSAVKFDNGKVILDNPHVDGDNHTLAKSVLGFASEHGGLEFGTDRLQSSSLTLAVVPLQLLGILLEYKFIDLVLFVHLEKLANNGSGSILVRFALDILFIELKGLSTIRVAYELVSCSHSAAIGVDSFDDTCGLSRSQSRNIRQKIGSVSIVHRFVDIHTAEVNHVYHSRVQILGQLVRWEEVLARVGDAVPRDGVKTRVLGKGARTVFVQASNLIVHHHNFQGLRSIVIGVRVLKLRSHETLLVDQALQVTHQLGRFSRPTAYTNDIGSTAFHKFFKLFSLALVSSKISQFSLLDHSSIFLHPCPTNRITGGVGHTIGENQDARCGAQNHALGLVRRLVKSLRVFLPTHLEYFILTESTDDFLNILCDDLLQLGISEVQHLLALFSPLLGSITEVFGLKFLLDSDESFLFGLHHFQEKLWLMNQVGNSLVLCRLRNHFIHHGVVNFHSFQVVDRLLKSVSLVHERPELDVQLQDFPQIVLVQQLVRAYDIFGSIGIIAIRISCLPGVEQVVFAVLEHIRHLNLVDDEEFEDFTNCLAKWALQVRGKTFLGPKLVGDPACLFLELLCRELQALERLSVDLESLGLEYVLQLYRLFFSFAVLLLFLHLQCPIVVFAIAKDSFHVIQGILIQIGGVGDVSDDTISGTGNLGVFSLLF
ncbi:hypothetical protein HG531_008165 [Fusarium graminearum]|nr:hypothetical protein HG531_008165 [Fusarium graminearum]